MFRISLLLLALMTARVEASDLPTASKPKPSKSKLNTQIYEQESETKSFTDTVKVLREVAGTHQVFFNSQNGVFYLDASLESGSAQNFLAMSQSKKMAVKVTVDMATRQITSVSQQDKVEPRGD